MREGNNVISDTAKIINIEIGHHNSIYNYAELKSCKLGDHIKIGDFAMLVDSHILGNSSINRRNFILRSTIGRYTYTGINTLIRSTTIGNFCSISWNVSIGGGNHDMDCVTTSTKERFYFLDDVEDRSVLQKESLNRIAVLPTCSIGNDVWIATNVVILNGIKIGNGAVIGAGAVVTKDVEPYSIVAGVPAKKIKMRFDDKTIAALEEIKWWDWPIEVIRENLDLIYSTKVDESVLEKMQLIKESLK